MHGGGSERAQLIGCAIFFFCLNLPSPLPLFPCYTHSVYTNAVTKASRPLVGDEIDAAGEFLHVSLRRPIDR